MSIEVNKTWVQNLTLLPVYNILNRGLHGGRHRYHVPRTSPAVPSLSSRCWTGQDVALKSTSKESWKILLQESLASFGSGKDAGGNQPWT